ncbi:MAG: hypothetical protein ACMG51_09345 [Ginsengibacter sp.]
MGKIKFLYLIFFAIIFFSCATSKHEEKNVEATMQYYNHLIRNLDADSIALLFTPDGNLGGIAKGRDSIRRFLSTFKNIEVLSQRSSTNFLKITKDSALQKGLYWQQDVVNKKDTFNVKGEFTARWQKFGKENWLLKEMQTKTIK